MKPSRCPKCDSELPRKGRFCLDCGLDLYTEGIRRAPIPWLQILILLIVGVVAVVLLVAPPWQSKTPFEIEEARNATKDFVALVAGGDYEAIVQRYYKPDAARFKETEQQLWEIVRGQGARGRKIFDSQEFRDLEAAIAYVRKNETANVGYVARLLSDMCARSELWMSPQRTEVFFAWYLEQAFGGIEATPEQIGVDGPHWREGFLTVKLTFPEAPEPPRGVEDPTVLRWRLVGGWGGCRKGHCVLVFGQRNHLDEVLDLLKRLPAE